MALLESHRSMSAADRGALKPFVDASGWRGWLDRFTGFDPKPYQTDLTTGVVRLLALSARRVRALRARLDEGPAVFLDIGESQTVGLFGAWLLEFKLLSDFDPLLGLPRDTEFRADLHLEIAPVSRHVLNVATPSDRFIPFGAPLEGELPKRLPSFAVLPAPLDEAPAYFVAADFGRNR